MSKKTGPSRRQFLTTSLAASGGLAASVANAGDPLITEVQPWARSLGKGVDQMGYGLPSPFEAHVLRKSVPWLTAESTSSINFTPLHQLDGIITPNGLAFERHHSGVAEIAPEDYRLMVNGLVDQPMVFTIEDLMRFPRHNKVYFLECTANSGMEWRGPQLNGVQFTHGMIHPEQMLAGRGEDFASRFGLGFSPQDREENIRRVKQTKDILGLPRLPEEMDLVAHAGGLDAYFQLRVNKAFRIRVP